MVKDAFGRIVCMTGSRDAWFDFGAETAGLPCEPRQNMIFFSGTRIQNFADLQPEQWRKKTT